MTECLSLHIITIFVIFWCDHLTKVKNPICEYITTIEIHGERT